jgi:proteasome lid subunit RPN8/RPN11
MSSHEAATAIDVTVSPAVLQAIAAHARSENPRECCGLLIGVQGRIVEAIRSLNSASDPIRRYEIAPVEYIAQIKRCRSDARGYRVIGAYHSHPKGPPEPSETDRAEAFHDFLFLIAGPVHGEMPVDIRAYELIGEALQSVNLISA